MSLWSGRTPLSFRFFLFSGVHMAAMGRPDTSVFPLSPLFRGAHGCDGAAGHLCLSPFPSFQGCTWLRWGGRTPRSFPFPLFSGVHMAAMGRPDTSVFPLFPLFRGAHGCDGAAGHLCLSPFPSFQGCYRRHYKSVSIFSGGTISAELKMPHSPSQEFVPAKQDANRSPSPLLLPSIPSMVSRTIHQSPSPQTFL